MSSLSDVSVVSTSFFAGFVVVTLIALAAALDVQVEELVGGMSE